MRIIFIQMQAAAMHTTSSRAQPLDMNQAIYIHNYDSGASDIVSIDINKEKMRRQLSVDNMPNARKALSSFEALPTESNETEQDQNPGGTWSSAMNDRYRQIVDELPPTERSMGSAQTVGQKIGVQIACRIAPARPGKNQEIAMKNLTEGRSSKTSSPVVPQRGKSKLGRKAYTNVRSNSKVSDHGSGSSNERMSRGQNTEIQKNLDMFGKEGLQDYALYSIFTTKQPSKYVVVQEGRAIKGSELMYFNKIHDAPRLQIGQEKPLLFKFDNVHDEGLSGRQDKVYHENVSHMVNAMVEKSQNAAVILFGPTGGGKTYTLKGGQQIQERGLAPRVVEHILSKIKNPEKVFGQQAQHPKLLLKAQMYMITTKKIVDLLPRNKEKTAVHLQHQFDEQDDTVVSSLQGLNDRLILCLEDFFVAIADAFRCRKELSQTEFRDKELRKRSHFVINLALMRQSNSGFRQISQMNIVELSGSEQAVTSTSQRESEFVSKSFNSLSCKIMHTVVRKKSAKESNSQPQIDSKLVQCLSPTLTTRSNILLMACVEPIPEMLNHSLPGLKFCSSLREHIKSKFQLAEKKVSKKDGAKAKRPAAVTLSSLKVRLCDLEQEVNEGRRSKEIIKALSQLLTHIQLLKDKKQQNYLSDRVTQLLQVCSQGSISIEDQRHNYATPQPDSRAHLVAPQEQQFTSIQSQQEYQLQMPGQVGPSLSEPQHRTPVYDNVATFQGHSRQTLEDQAHANAYLANREHELAKQFESLDRREQVGDNNGAHPYSARQSHVEPEVESRPPSQQLVRPNSAVHTGIGHVSRFGSRRGSMSRLTEMEAPRPRALKGVIMSLESKFSQVFRENPLPTLVQVGSGPGDLKSYEEVFKECENDEKVQFRVNQLQGFFDELKNKQLYYKDEQEMSAEIGRLLLLQDQQGLKMRFSQIYKERDMVISHAMQQLKKTAPVETQKIAMETLLTNYKEALAQNRKKAQGYLEQIDVDLRVVETELMDQLKAAQQTIEQQAEAVAHAEEGLKDAVDERDKAEKQRSEAHKSHLEAQSQATDLRRENERLRQNYEVLKEHEMTIIRDVENRKKEDLADRDQQLIEEREKLANVLQDMERKQVEIQALKHQIRNHENDINQGKAESSSIQERLLQANTEIDALKAEISEQKQSKFIEIERAARLKTQLDLEREEKVKLDKVISGMREELLTKANGMDTQMQVTAQLRNSVKAMEQQIEALNSEKKAIEQNQQDLIDAQMQENTNKEIQIQQRDDHVKDLERQLEKLQQMYAAKDQELTQVKAKQFDKLDVMQKLNAAEARASQADLLNEDFARKLDESAKNLEQTRQKLTESQEKCEVLTAQIQAMNIDQDTNMDALDKKFESMAKQLGDFREENSAMRALVEELRGEVIQKEKDRTYWQEKCKVAEAKGQQINVKIVELEQDLRLLIAERDSKGQGSFRKSPKHLRRSSQGSDRENLRYSIGRNSSLEPEDYGKAEPKIQQTAYNQDLQFSDQPLQYPVFPGQQEAPKTLPVKVNSPPNFQIQVFDNNQQRPPKQELMPIAEQRSSSSLTRRPLRSQSRGCSSPKSPKQKQSNFQFPGSFGSSTDHQNIEQRAPESIHSSGRDEEPDYFNRPVRIQTIGSKYQANPTPQFKSNFGRRSSIENSKGSSIGRSRGSEQTFGNK